MSASESDEDSQPRQTPSVHQQNLALLEQRQPPPPPPRYAWVRPRMQEFPVEINLYVRDSVLCDIPLVLNRNGGQNLVDQFRNGPFGRLLDIRRKGSSNQALHELVARELKDSSFSEFERWFHVGGRDIRFSALEYALVTGLTFGASDFNPHGEHTVPESSILHTYYNGEKTRALTLKRDFFNRKVNLGSPAQYLRAANLLMFYFMLVCGDNLWIDDWAWTLVEDDARWARFPWGSWSFQVLCHGLGLVKKDPTEIKNDRGAYHFYGAIWAFNIWAYEAIPRLGGLCGYREVEALRPRFRRWQTFAASLDVVGFFDNHELEIFETLVPTDQEVMEPYYISLDCPDPFVVRFNASKRHASKKLSIEERQSKSRREMARVNERLTCRDVERDVVPRRGASRAPPPRARAEKRPRTVRRDISGLVCCVHGDPCRLGADSDDWMDVFVDKLWSRALEDRSRTGFISRVARAVALHAKDYFGSRGSRSSSGHGSRSPSPSHSHHHGRERHASMGEPSHHDQHYSPHRDRSPTPEGSRRSHRTQEGSRRSRSQALSGSNRVETPSETYLNELEDMSPLREQILGFQHRATSPPSEDSDVFETDDEQLPEISRAGRQTKPSAFLQSPFVAPGAPYKSTFLRQIYNDFRSKGPGVDVSTRQEHPFPLPQVLFDRIEDMKDKFTAEMIELYILYWRTRLKDRFSVASGVGYMNTIVCGLDLYKDLMVVLKKQNKDDPKLGLKSTSKYTKWVPEKKFIEVFKGTNTYKPWHTARYFIFVCHVGSDHWVVVRVCVEEWRVEVYDSLLFKLNTRHTREHRTIQLLPITRLFPRVLWCSCYWSKNPSLQQRNDAFELVFMPPHEQFNQVDGVSCGVFACLYIDRLLAKETIITGTLTETALQRARRRIGRRIYSLSVRQVVG